MRRGEAFDREKRLDHETRSLLDRRYNWSYTTVMKTAISIPDDLFASAEQAARRLGVSRSELYASALREYLAAHRFGDVTEQLDAVYAEEDSHLDTMLARLQTHSLSQDEW